MKLPFYFQLFNIIQRREVHRYNTRQRNSLCTPESTSPVEITCKHILNALKR